MKVNRKLLPWAVAAGAAELLLASWQWFELESIRRGGEAPFCAINARVSCQTVWTSPMAVRVSEMFGIPVAGLGVVWGLVAAFLALRRSADRAALPRDDEPSAPAEEPPAAVLTTASVSGSPT